MNTDTYYSHVVLFSFRATCWVYDCQATQPILSCIDLRLFQIPAQPAPTVHPPPLIALGLLPSFTL